MIKPTIQYTYSLKVHFILSKLDLEELFKFHCNCGNISVYPIILCENFGLLVNNNTYDERIHHVSVQ